MTTLVWMLVDITGPDLGMGRGSADGEGGGHFVPVTSQARASLARHGLRGERQDGHFNVSDGKRMTLGWRLKWIVA
jgi:hypothetical protein